MAFGLQVTEASARSLSPDRSHNEVDGIFFLAGIMQLDHYVQADKVTAIDQVFRGLRK